MNKRVVDEILTIMMRHLKVRSCKQCDNNPSFHEFTITAHGNKKYLIKIKESLLIKLNQPVLKTLVPLCYIYSTWFIVIG